MAARLDLGGGYSIDLADAEKFVKALQDTHDRLYDTLKGTAAPLRVYAPGHDNYSGMVANAYNNVVDQHHEWNERKREELKALIQCVTAATDLERPGLRRLWFE
ncbi:hypothetical protein, partial [Kibdelosporangium philippinense]|uniref:hypothetical protein n=1 Tax=Kibdelosporangium philippinense TaxID=211113 RepID=UPI0035E8BF62